LWKTLARWKNNLKFARNVDQTYSQEFGQIVGSHNKPGQTIQVPKPQRFQVYAQQAAVFQGITNLTTPLTMSTQAHVAYLISSAERYLNADHMYERYGKPAADALSNYIDYQAFLFATNTTPNFVGTPGGGAPTSNQIYINAGPVLDNFDCPMNTQDRMMLVSPQMMANAVYQDQTLFHANQEIEMQYRTGAVGEAHGFQWFKSQNTPTQTGPTYAGTPTVSGAGQTGSTLATTGWTSGTLPQGFRFTIGSGATGVFTVNAQSRQSIGALQNFIVTSPVTLGAGTINIPVYPPMNSTGSYQNISQAPPAGAAINGWVASGVTAPIVTGLAFHEKAFAVVYGKLDVPDKGVIEAYGDTDPETGCFMRYMMYLDGDNDNWKVRWDILFGYGALYPEWSVVVAN
jgi:hypothetical protein